VAVEVAAGAVVVLGGAGVGMPGQDLGIAQRHGCVQTDTDAWLRCVRSSFRLRSKRQLEAAQPNWRSLWTRTYGRVTPRFAAASPPARMVSHRTRHR
jgi:hypothetical protein